MNLTHRSAAFALCLAAGAAVLVAGPLTPPAGPITPTYKTLSEVEPRVPLSSATTPGDLNNVYRITQPGSYYLTGNLVTGQRTGISIEASGVTVDLRGFEISDAVPAIGSTRQGIYIQLGVKNASVLNGTIRGTNTDGIKNQGVGSRFRDLSFNACLANGLRSDNACVVESCSATGCTLDGFVLINSSVTRCVSSGNSGRGIFNTSDGVTVDCLASNNIGAGFETNGGLVSRCSSSGNLYGFVVAGARISECNAGWNNSGGIKVYSGCQVLHNTADTPQGFPNILVAGSDNRIEGNHTVLGSSCVQVATGWSDNIIIGNTSVGAANAFNVNVASNMVGPVVVASGTITTTSPFANFAQ